MNENTDPGSVLPPYGLSGGGMRFDPGSLLLFIDDKNAAFRLFSTRPDPEEVDRHPFDEIARFMHERDHLLRHLSTSFGLLRHAIVSQLFADALQLIDTADLQELCHFEGLFARGGRTVHTAAARAEPPLQDLSRTSSSWAHQEKALLRYIARLELLRALDGDPDFSNPRLAEWGLAFVEAGLAAAFPTLTQRRGRYARTWDDDEFPEIHPFVGAEQITSRSIFEAFAFETELIYAFKRGRDLSQSTDLDADVEYRLCAVLFERAFRGKIRDRMPVEFDAMLDVALWIPITLGGTLLVKPTHTWLDLHPGWRLSKAFDWALEHDIEFSYGEDMTFADCDRAVATLQTRLCADLGWPTPAHLCDLWVVQLESYLQGPTTIASFMHLADEHPRLHWAARLLRERRDHPFSLYHRTPSELKGVAEVAFPGGVFRNTDVVYTAPNGFGDGPDNLSFKEYQTLTTARLLVEGPREHPMFRHHVRLGLGLIEGLADQFLGPHPDRARRYAVVAEALAHLPPTDLPQERPARASHRSL